ncbi:2726_t:CDS:2 [Ambispora gerdemannii]|uniref:2726_t:CDS:1 n=1 Tax=Ambispora gerdemannii TaxID=144530 RepID=A0A9N8VCZ0_9GLOM|nr:2726_t:CDS:2 [Ambispora gerdemannii]
MLDISRTRLTPCKIRALERDKYEFTIKRQEVLQTLENLQTESQKVLDIIENPEVIAALRQDKLQNLHFLKEKYGLTEDMVNTLYHSGQFQYNCGNYGGAADMLYHYRVLSTDHEQNLSALWGKLASEILAIDWDNALEELQKLRETIDQKNFASALHQLQQRAWFIHWSIFVFFNHPKGRDGIIDVFFQPQYINTIQTSCPWILRYLTTAVVTNKRRKNILKDLVKIIQQESYEYRDPITEFIECLYVNFDFEGAQHKLKECEQNTVIMNQNHTSIYQQAIERTKGLSFRSQVLASTIEKRESHNQNPNAIE